MGAARCARLCSYRSVQPVMVAYSLKVCKRNAMQPPTSRATRIRSPEALNDRMRANEDSVRAVGALFGTMSVVTRDDWRRFVDRLSPIGEDSDIDDARLRRSGSSLASVASRSSVRCKPRTCPSSACGRKGARDEYAAVTFIEPFSATTRRLLGYDLLANEQSRSAIERAARTGGVSVSSRWTVQANGARVASDSLDVCARLSARERGRTSSIPSSLSATSTPQLQCDDLMDEVLHGSVANIGLAVYDGVRGLVGFIAVCQRSRAMKSSTQRSEPAFDTRHSRDGRRARMDAAFRLEPYAKAVPG